MKNKDAVKDRKQGWNAPQTVATMMQQLVLPLIVGVEATRKGLFSFVHQMGMVAVNELLAMEASAIAGPKGKHVPDRGYHHWGTTRTALPFGGRNAVIERPRVRRRKG